jgi:FkbM family methyltransferase
LRFTRGKRDMKPSNALQRVGRMAASAIGRDSLLVHMARPVYENVLAASTFGRGIEWRINGETFRIDPHQRHRLGSCYDPTVAAFLRERIRPGSLCVDVGANVGAYVLQFARWSGPQGRVIAFEPNPGACVFLKRHVAMNRLANQVRVVPAAVGAAGSTALMFVSGTNGMSRLGMPNPEIESRTSTIEVSVVSLDDFFRTADRDPDWLLIDIEGFELAALEGARELVARRPGTLSIVAEMHPSAWMTNGQSRETAERLLDELRLRAIPLTGQIDPLAEHGLVHLAHV